MMIIATEKKRLLQQKFKMVIDTFLDQMYLTHKQLEMHGCIYC